MTRHCRAWTFKIPGPWINFKLFSKPVSCVAHYFCEFCKEADHCFPWFCMNSSFNSTFIFLTVIHSSYCFQGPSILTWGTLSHRSHMFQRFHLFLASLVMTRKNIRLEWFGRGNIDDIETSSKKGGSSALRMEFTCWVLKKYDPPLWEWNLLVEF